MTREEMRGVWTLLGKFREGDARLKDKDLMTAWWLTFQPYEAEDLRKALAAHFRRKSFFPDVKEIAALLPPLPPGDEIPPPETAQGAAKPGMSRSAVFSARWDAGMTARGYPSLGEWLDRGKPADEWWLARGGIQAEDDAYWSPFPPGEREKFRRAAIALERELTGAAG